MQAWLAVVAFMYAGQPTAQNTLGDAPKQVALYYHPPGQNGSLTCARISSELGAQLLCLMLAAALVTL